MASSKKLYAITNVSTPNGLVRSGDEITDDLTDDARKALIDGGVASESKSEADKAAGESSVDAPLEVVEEEVK